MPMRSAGILPYRHGNGAWEVPLTHPEAHPIGRFDLPKFHPSQQGFIRELEGPLLHEVPPGD